MPLGNVHLTPQLVAAVRDAADILSIAGDHTRLRKAGRRWLGLCPIHKEKTPSFSVDPTQGLFYCFGCGAGGDAIKLHQILTGEDFPAAIETLANRYGIPLPAVGPRRASEGPDLGDVLASALGFFRDQLAKSVTARSYLERRKMPPELVERFGLGYAPDAWRSLKDALGGRHTQDELLAAGLLVRPEERDKAPYDRFRNRLMFPIHDPGGHLVGFGGRTLGDDRAKYVNTAETERFRKGHLLYGLHHARKPIREAGRAFLVEGYFDVLAAVAAGIDTAVASMGTALTPEQAKLFLRYHADEVVVGYDGDEAGETASRRALPILLAEGLGARRARLGAGEDPDSLRAAKGDAAVREAYEKAPDLVQLELERLTPAEVHREPRLRSRAAEAVAELLRPVRDPVLRYSYGRIGADRLAIPAELLWKRLGVDRQSLLAPVVPDAAAAPRRIVASTEEGVLQAMLQGDPTLPAIEELPAPEVFLDPQCRNIYQVFRDLYDSGRGVPPDARAVQARLGNEGPAIDVLARLLLERQDGSTVEPLSQRLAQLSRRSIQQRLRENARDMTEAERLGDHDRIERLKREKAALIRARYPGASDPWGGGS